MVHNVKDLSPDQRLVIEGLLGRALHDEESLTIRPARVLKDAPTGRNALACPAHTWITSTLSPGG
jgi:hypothetical protein